MTASPYPVAIVFKQILEGDLRKLLAESNDAPTGGGARDLRFPYEPFRPVLERFFPRITQDTDNGGRVREGRLVWHLKNKSEHFSVEFWPPTRARPTEGRIARIHGLPPLLNCPHPTIEDPVFIILTLDSTGEFRADYARLSSLHSQWSTEIVTPIKSSLLTARTGRAACGWYLIQSHQEYLHK